MIKSVNVDEVIECLIDCLSIFVDVLNECLMPADWLKSQKYARIIAVDTGIFKAVSLSNSLIACGV